MKILSIGTDNKIFEKNSAVRQRVVEYGSLFEALHIVVFSARSMNYESKIMLSENVFAYPTNSRNKLFYIWDAFCIGRALSSKFLASSSVISTQDPFETGIVGLALKLFYKLPLQVQVHTDFANRYFITHSFLNFIRFPLGLFILSFANSVRVVSERVAKSIHSLSHNVSVLPIYTEVGNSRPSAGSKDKISFLTVCRLEKEKDLKTAIRAFKKVLDKGIKAEFVIVGNGSERKNLEDLCQDLKITNDVMFVGWQNELGHFYDKADIYISASLYEGYGLSVMRAASHGLSLVISDAGIAGDIFKDEAEAFIRKPKDVDGFGEAMIKLARDSDLRKKIGQRAKEAADKNQISHSEYLEKYKDLVKQAQKFNDLNYGLFKRNILLRYFVAGITGASTQIGLLYIFTDIAGLWYIYSSILAFIVAVAVSFTLQKFWTFADGKTEKIHHQFTRYMGVAVMGIFINTACMYLLVDIWGVWYIFSQIVTGAIIAVFNFLMYKFFIFNEQ